jgi:uncharacterized damage-inducible protein DinB
MIDLGYVQCLARYNRWQNENLYAVAERLSDGERRRERGAFFGSIHATLNHLLWADRIWMSRLAGTPRPAGGIPESVSFHNDWGDLKHERADDLTWFSGAIKAEVTKPKWLLITHMFNHQTHHRGQVHCMLTQAGGKPGDTDLFIMPRA